MENNLSSFCNDWVQTFPWLKRYNNGRKLIAQSETIVYGIELRKISENTYRPEFICLNLLSGLNEFSLCREFALSKNPQGNIGHKSHSHDFPIIAQAIKTQMPLLNKPKPSADEVVKLYQTQIDYDLSRGSNPTASMAALVQQTVFFKLYDVEKAERKRLAEYFNALPKNVKVFLGPTLEKQLSETLESMLENRRISIAKAAWPSPTN